MLLFCGFYRYASRVIFTTFAPMYLFICFTFKNSVRSQEFSVLHDVPFLAVWRRLKVSVNSSSDVYECLFGVHLAF